jgi:hypothetical protein
MIRIGESSLLSKGIPPYWIKNLLLKENILSLRPQGYNTCLNICFLTIDLQISDLHPLKQYFMKRFLFAENLTRKMVIRGTYAITNMFASHAALNLMENSLAINSNQIDIRNSNRS